MNLDQSITFFFGLVWFSSFYHPSDRWKCMKTIFFWLEKQENSMMINSIDSLNGIHLYIVIILVLSIIIWRIFLCVCVCVWSCYFVDCWKLWWLLNHVFGDYCTVCVCKCLYKNIEHPHQHTHIHKMILCN